MHHMHSADAIAVAEGFAVVRSYSRMAHSVKPADVASGCPKVDSGIEREVAGGNLDQIAGEVGEVAVEEALGRPPWKGVEVRRGPMGLYYCFDND